MGNKKYFEVLFSSNTKNRYTIPHKILREYYHLKRENDELSCDACITRKEFCIYCHFGIRFGKLIPSRSDKLLIECCKKNKKYLKTSNLCIVGLINILYKDCVVIKKVLRKKLISEEVHINTNKYVDDCVKSFKPDNTPEKAYSEIMKLRNDPPIFYKNIYRITKLHSESICPDCAEFTDESDYSTSEDESTENDSTENDNTENDSTEEETVEFESSEAESSEAESSEAIAIEEVVEEEIEPIYNEVYIG